MTWWDLVPGLIAAVFVLFLPGLVVAAGWRLKPLAALPLAPLLSLAIIGATTLPASALNVPWGFWWVLGGTLVFAAPGLLRWRRRLIRGGRQDNGGLARLFPYLCGIALADAILGRRIMWVLGSPLSVAQRWDNAFHLNAAAHVVFTGNASIFDLGELSGAAYYPATFHDSVALVASLARLDIIPAIHAVILVTIFLVWPISLVILLETFFRVSIFGQLALGTFALGLNTFPYVLMDWGLVYPNILAVAVSPALIALIVRVLGKGSFSLLPWKPAIGLLVPAIVGAALVHPNAVCLAFAVCLPLVVLNAVQLLTGRQTEVPRIWAVFLGVALVLAAVVGCYVWLKLSRSLSTNGWTTDWKPFETFSQGLGETITATTMGRSAFPAFVLVVIGLLLMLKAWRRHFWWLISAAIISSFYVVAVSSTNQNFRGYYTGVFYTDNYRMAAYVAISMVPVGIMGTQWVCEFIMSRLHHVMNQLNSSIWSYVDILLALLISFILVVLTVGSTAFEERLGGIRDGYLMQENGEILSPDEIAVMEQISRVVPPDSTIIVNPWQGGNLVYAFSQRNPSQFYMMVAPSDNVRFINENLNQAASYPQVCQALARENASYVLDLDPHWISGAESDEDIRADYSGLENLDSAPGFTPVLQVGSDTLYRVTACD